MLLFSKGKKTNIFKYGAENNLALEILSGVMHPLKTSKCEQIRTSVKNKLTFSMDIFSLQNLKYLPSI